MKIIVLGVLLIVFILSTMLSIYEEITTVINGNLDGDQVILLFVAAFVAINECCCSNQQVEIVFRNVCLLLFYVFFAPTRVVYEHPRIFIFYYSFCKKI